MFLDGSSGLGKTQMAFNLFRNLTSNGPLDIDRRKVFYFVTLQGGEENVQAIYSNFMMASGLLISALNLDLLFNANQITPTIDTLFERPSWIFGLIRVMLNLYNQSNINENHNPDINTNVEQCTGHNIIALLTELGIQNLRPVIIIDEVIQAGDTNNKQKLRRLRNTFRCLGFGLILLGTDSTAIDIASTIGLQSRRTYNQEWCCVYGNFPQTHIIHEDNEQIPNYIQSILEASRPLFSFIVCEKYLEIRIGNPQTDSIDIMNDVVAMSFRQLSLEKEIFDKEHGRLGQIRLFLNTSYPCPENESNTYIHSHFAYFNGDKDFIIDSKGKVNNRSFRPSSVYPTAQEDALLYLILMGGVNYSAFMENGNVVPAGYFFNQQNSGTIIKETTLNYNNANQISNDGQYLEALLSTTAIVSSHVSGLRGVLLHDYLLDIAYQIQQKAIVRNPNQVLFNFGQLVFLGAQYRLPYFLPPNLARPDFLSPEVFVGSNINTLSRTRNAERIDISTGEGVGLSGESKDWSAQIPNSLMIEMMNRIPEESSLHIVFVRHLHEDYSSIPALLLALDAQAKPRRCVYFKIEEYNNATLVPINGLPSDAVDGTTDCAVIFYVVPMDLERLRLEQENLLEERKEKRIKLEEKRQKDISDKSARANEFTSKDSYLNKLRERKDN